MRFVHYVKNNMTRAGLVQRGKVFDLLDLQEELGFAVRTQSNPLTLEKILSGELLRSIRRNESKVYHRQSGTQIESVRLLSPVLNPEKILLAKNGS